jgi:hypothetical protein
VFKTPDITPAQGIGIVGALVAVAAAFGFNITDDQRDAILQLATILSAVLFAGDAVIRHGRATGNAQKGEAPAEVVVSDEQVHKAVAGVLSAMAASSARPTATRGKAAASE